MYRPFSHGAGNSSNPEIGAASVVFCRGFKKVLQPAASSASSFKEFSLKREYFGLHFWFLIKENLKKKMFFTIYDSIFCCKVSDKFGICRLVPLYPRMLHKYLVT